MSPSPDDDPEAAAREADRLLAATLYLMTCHARTGCPRLAAMIRHHLELAARHAGSGEHVGHMSRKLANAWRAVMAHDAIYAGKPGRALH